ncbi:MAG TPA: flavoprotein [Sedimentisphaerales bacterium]|nr:flavoprotein [Sedimentisphaerales bacterium]
MSRDESNLKNMNILLGVSGGVAAYKAVDLASKLGGAGAGVKTVMTANACRLVGPKSFEAVTCSAVFTDLWGASEEYKISHIALGDWADIIVVAPATANIIGKLANGICDDLLSTVLCTCWAKPTLLAAAMNEKMWNNPAVQRNVEMVKKMGVQVVGPGKGRLACGAEGVGRMSEPQDILEAIGKIASKIKKARSTKS